MWVCVCALLHVDGIVVVCCCCYSKYDCVNSLSHFNMTQNHVRPFHAFMFRFFSLIPIDSSTSEHQRLNMRVNKMREYSMALRHTYRIVTVCVCVAVSLKPKCLFVHVLRPFVLFFQFEMQNKLNGIKVYTQRITMTTSANTHIQSASLPWLGQNEKEKCENVLKNEKQREKKSWKQLKMNEIQITFSYIKLVFSLVVVILNGVAQ